MPGQLYLIATPIGNLEDITLRAVRLLSEVSVVACEDTRQTSKLLSHLGLSKPVISCHQHNEEARATELISRMQAGESVAFVSDAGTPLVSDPGYRLTKATIDAGISVVPIPGPCALITALAASGLPAETFRFGAFLPPKTTARRQILETCTDSDETVIFYEAPHRLVDSLRDIHDVLGPERPIVVARELTKLYEEFFRGTTAAAYKEFSERPSIKGELVILIGPAPKMQANTEVTTPELAKELAELEAAGTSRMEGMKLLARRYGLGKRDIYGRLTAKSAQTRNALK